MGGDCRLTKEDDVTVQIRIRDKGFAGYQYVRRRVWRGRRVRASQAAVISRDV